MSKLNKMREQIANEFIAALQKDEIPWHQDWHNIGGAPHNAVTGRAYQSKSPMSSSPRFKRTKFRGIRIGTISAALHIMLYRAELIMG